jgi:type IX secretion system PorP/SprF family membrane protein
MRILSILFGLMVLPLVSGAQDIHYSQFDYSPLNLNPANAGLFKGSYRFAGNYRQQWRSVTVPYSTFSLSADGFEPLQKKNLGAGIQINHDIAGDSRFRTFQCNLSGAYLLPFKNDSTTRISLGATLGISARSLTYDALYFDNQYDGIQYNPSLANGENFNRESRAYMNLQLGAAFYRQLSLRNFITGGIALGNILKPKQSYFDVNSIKLDRRFNVHATLNYALDAQFELVPSVMGQFQGKYKEIIFGSQLRYIMLNEKGEFRAVKTGLFYRTRDAGYIMAGIDYNNWTGSVSYDLNFSKLVPASQHRGAIEFSVIYIINVFNPKMIQRRICPNYI